MKLNFLSAIGQS